MIRDIHRAFPYWSYAAIAELVGVSEREVKRILSKPDTYDIMRSDMNNKSESINIGNPMSPTDVKNKYDIPHSTIGMWIKRGKVKVIKDPGQTGPGLFTLLEPGSLQECIIKYKSRRKLETA